LTRKLGLISGAVVVIVFIAWIFARTHRSYTVRSYYRLERKWSDRQWNQRASMLASLEPLLLKSSVLGPARVEVERGISFFLDPRDLVPSVILKTGEWQPEIWDSIATALPEGGVFYDVGAHIGYFSMKAALRAGPAGRVVSFEPNPETVALLRDNARANHFDNVVVEPIACTEREETLTLYAAGEANTGASSLSADNATIQRGQTPKPYSVRGRPIDDVTNELKLTRVDVIKIDVEGAEGLVLRGALETLKRFHPKVMMEVVARQLASFQTTPEDLSVLMRSAGYNYSRPLNPEQTDWEWTAAPFSGFVEMGDRAKERQLVRGLYPVEGGAWRWTAKTFVIALGTPPEASKSGASLVFNFSIPPVAIDRLKGVTLSASIGGVALEPESFATQGDHKYRRSIPRSALGTKETVEIEFKLDRSLPAAEFGRELGVVAKSAGFESK
jgi:FkbM family methyltransferase